MRKPKEIELEASTKDVTTYRAVRPKIKVGADLALEMILQDKKEISKSKDQLTINILELGQKMQTLQFRNGQLETICENYKSVIADLKNQIKDLELELQTEDIELEANENTINAPAVNPMIEQFKEIFQIVQPLLFPQQNPQQLQAQTPIQTVNQPTLNQNDTIILKTVYYWYELDQDALRLIQAIIKVKETNPAMYEMFKNGMDLQ